MRIFVPFKIFKGVKGSSNRRMVTIKIIGMKQEDVDTLKSYSEDRSYNDLISFLSSRGYRKVWYRYDDSSYVGADTIGVTIMVIPPPPFGKIIEKTVSKSFSLLKKHLKKTCKTNVL